jgi:DNA replication and repair protein RecF
VREAGLGGALAVTRLTLTEFRNYRTLRLDVAPAPVVLTGANGAGKTNLLEALSFLAPGRGLRRARLIDIGRRQTGGRAEGLANWAVAATLATPDGPVDVGTGRDPEADPAVTGERRVVRIDGTPAKSQNALARLVGVAWLTPEMDRLFLEAASGRRRFLDRLAYGFAPDHAGHLGAYERAMRERARLLRDSIVPDPSWLGALEHAMAENGVAVAAARRETVERLNRAMALGAGVFPRPAVAINGTVESWLGEGPALAAEDRLRALLAGSRRQDAEAGGAAQGPHRSDLAVHHIDKDMPAALCSTGEQKALLVAIVLAAARLQAVERGAPPLLLLDEIAAHLDEARRAALFDEITALGAQAWMTGTDRRLFDALEDRAQFFTVADGALAPDRDNRILQ